MLSLTGSSMGLSFHRREGQTMQVWVGGIPAKEEGSTAVRQKRQSRPTPTTWCWWENGTGCVLGTPWWVTYEERCTVTRTQSTPPTRNRAPNRLTRAMVLVLGWKICGMPALPP